MLQEEGDGELAQTLPVALVQRRNVPFVSRSKFEHVVADGVLAAAETNLALRAARQSGSDFEEVLVSQFSVKPAAIGSALAKFFGV